MRDAATEIRDLREELTKRDELVSALQIQLAAIVTDNQRLQDLVAELKERLGQNSTNSGKPPSTDPPGSRSKDKSSKRSKKPSKRKRGGQPGHRGSHRVLLPPDQVDHVEDYYPKHCENCWKSLPEVPDENPQRYQVTEIPPVKPETVEYRAHGVTCNCGHTTRAKVPEHVRASSFGPRLMSIIVMLTGVFHLSRRQTAAAISDFFGVKISLGAISALEDRVSKALLSAVNQAWEKVQKAQVKHADGTGWRQSGRALQLWTIATEAVTVFKVLADGTTKSLKALLGQITGVLISDRAAALNFWAMDQRQICWSHLLRRFIAFSERDGPAGDYGRVLLDYTGILFDYYHAYKDGKISWATLRRRTSPLRLQVEQVLASAAQTKIKRLSGSCKNILAHQQALWTFLDNPQVSPTNNHAERELRRFVLWRKSSFGTQSERGNRFAERIMTVVHTTRKQNKPTLGYLTAVCKADRFGQPIPSLVG